MVIERTKIPPYQLNKNPSGTL